MGSEKPNTASWSLWVLVTTVNVGSYFTMSQDWYLSALLLTDTSLCVVIWLVAWWRRLFELPPRRDYLPITLTIVAVVIWKITSATDANVFTQLPMIISFMPYWMQAWRGEAGAKPWVVWTSSFVLDIPLIYLRHTQTGRGDWHDYLYVGLAVVLHGGVAVLALVKQNREERSLE